MKIKNTSDYIAFNSYGGFNSTKDEYHILNTATPLPWCNVIANERFGSVISTYGTVYTYYKNSREFKLTEWCNDWISFQAGEKFKGIFEKDYNLIYGFGYVKVLEEDNGLKKEMEIFVPENDDIKIHQITLNNTTSNTKQISISYKLEPVLGVSKETNQNYILSRINDEIMELKNPYSKDFSKCLAYLFSYSDNKNVISSYNLEDFSITLDIKVEPKEKVELAIFLGAVDDEANLAKIKEKYSSLKTIKSESKAVKKYWKDLVTCNFDTKDEYTNIMANGWLLYQTIVCRLFAKTAFYQAGGAIGFRDQLQDCLALIRKWPEKARSQIILHSSKQFEKGDVLHWWHEFNNAGIRTYFSDDYLWLPYVLSEYVDITGDSSILDVMTPYLEDKPMLDKRELYEIFNNIDVQDSVYDHAKRAIYYSLSRINEKNGLLDIGDGDWNDGFSNIRGQSVWLTLFMINVLQKFIKVAKIKKDDEMVKLSEKHIHIFKHNVLSYAWEDGQFVRAFFENGDVLGSMSNKECKIDLISQAWAVIALKDYPDVQDELNQALKKVDKYLVDHENQIVRLLYPSFDKPKNNPGYIKAYVPGTRENGGQYTHASTWLAKAYFEMKDNEKALQILKYINPIYHSDTKEKADKYMVEPYVVAADVYTNPDHVGRGGWTWYTGSSAWMYKVIEDYLGNNKKHRN